MNLSSGFYESIDEKRIIRLRIIMKDSLLLDTSFKRFEKMQEEAGDLEGLYDPHDGEAFESDRSKWDDDYMDLEMVRVVNNFSHERLDHLKELVSYLRPEEEKKSISIDPGLKPGYQEQKRRDEEEGLIIKMAIWGGAGALVGGAVALIASKPLILGAAVGGAVGATATYVVLELEKGGH